MDKKQQEINELNTIGNERYITGSVNGRHDLAMSGIAYMQLAVSLEGGYTTRLTKIKQMFCIHRWLPLRFPYHVECAKCGKHDFLGY